MMYQITFYAVYAWFTIGYVSYYNEITFKDQESCLLYLYEHKEELTKSAAEMHKQLEVDGKTYVLEGFNIECDQVYPEV